MSTQDTAALIESVNKMTATVAGKMGEIDKRVNGAEEEYQSLISGIRSDFPFYRITKNQELKIGGVLTPGSKGTPDGFINRSAAGHICEIVAHTQTGVSASGKHEEIQAMYLDLKGSVPKYNAPDFAILRVTTLDDVIGTNGQYYTIYQGPIPNGIPYSIGCFVKAESGLVRFGLPYASNDVPVDGKWHERILRFDMAVGGANYTHAPHLYVTPGSSALIALPAVVAGKVPDGKWGYFLKPIFENGV